jgi:hypothetical protein
MNERIKELAKQADNYAYKMNPEQDSYGRSANPRKFQQDRDAKFAELIVKQCAGVAEVSMSISSHPDDRLTVKNSVLKHFGVEE